MRRRIFIAVPLVVGALALTACASTVKFKSLDVTEGGDRQVLTGKLMKPRGDGPFPAVVMLHGCDGLKDFYAPWADRLRRWGYVTLRVDSFRPRGKSNLCARGRGYLIDPLQRSLDAHGAKCYLAGLPFVDHNRIAVMGWSHGARATLEAVNDKSWRQIPGDPFRTGVAFYSWCRALVNLNAPLLILIGEKDDWTPAARCRAFMPSEETKHEIVLKVYPGAYHSFDLPVRGQWYMGHWVEHNSRLRPMPTTESENSLRSICNKMNCRRTIKDWLSQLRQDQWFCYSCAKLKDQKTFVLCI